MISGLNPRQIATMSIYCQKSFFCSVHNRYSVKSASQWLTPWWLLPRLAPPWLLLRSKPRWLTPCTLVVDTVVCGVSLYCVSWRLDDWRLSRWYQWSMCSCFLFRFDASLVVALAVVTLLFASNFVGGPNNYNDKNDILTSFQLNALKPKSKLLL